MKTKDLRNKTVEGLNKNIEEKREKLQKLKFDLATRKNKNHREVRKVKREIARILTIISEKNFLADNKEK